MKDNQKNSKLKMTKKFMLEDTQKNQNGRQPKKMKDDQNKLKMEDNQNKFKMEEDNKMKDNQKSLISRISKCNNNND